MSSTEDHTPDTVEAPGGISAVEAAPTAPPAPSAPTPPTAPQQDPTPEAPATTRWLPRAAAAATAGVLLAALAGVGIGYGIRQAQHDDDHTKHDAIAVAPTPAAPAPAPSGKPATGTMSDLLLPVPAGFSLGLNGGDLGADTENGPDLTKEQQAAQLDAELDVLPQDQRAHAKAQLPAAGPKALGTRGYRSDDHQFVATIWLDQFASPADAATASQAFDGAWSADATGYRVGPVVPGHQDAVCVLPRFQPGEPIDEMDCTATVGGLLVAMRVEGVIPEPTSEAVSLFRQQLERLALPGASA
ncbi:hypothetical protein ACFYNO_38100 [Kitasatospora sp. NPDC006697]|uniref:hypothetical protein n=1 Tax=Kitasatospora sp. NPDC006697 TaxID=3364020 RepID=UPI0036B5C9B2